MDNQDGATNPSQAPQWVTQDIPKKNTKTPRKPFTTAREYKKFFTSRLKQIPKTQEVQEFQEVVDQNF